MFLPFKKRIHRQIGELSIVVVLIWSFIITSFVPQIVDAKTFEFVNLNWEDYVVQDPNLFRPAEVDLLVGDPSKAKENLGWEPQVSFKELIEMMVRADIERLGKQQRDKSFVAG